MSSIPLSARWSPAQVAFALVAASLALHAYLSGLLPLSPQEAYYWQWGRHLDLSYFDHPPLAAWTIRLTTAFLGDGERGVRAAALVHAGLFALFFFLAGRRLFGGRAALLATAAGVLTPLYALGQSVITPDTPLLAGWAAALYFTVRALDEERGPWLLAAGAAVGLAALGKYTGWLLAPQIFLALLLDARGRRLLGSPWPWLALALAVAVFSPVLAWNARHGWISFRFQLGWRASTGGGFSPRRLASFIGLQAGTQTPLLFAGLVAAAVAAARRWREPAFRLCALFSAPGLLLFLGLSPFVWVKGNWAAPCYASALLAAAALVERGSRGRRRYAGAALGLAALGTVYLHLALAVPALPFPAKDDPTAGWKELAARVAAEQARLPAPSFVVGCTYKPASELAYYLPGRPETWSQNAIGEAGLQYSFWGDLASLPGREGIVVLDRREWKNCLPRETYCRPLEELPPLVIHRADREVTTFRLWRCRYAGP
ncbi:MAG TPA: glycosyltransferase family 39 protein [Anaeromyxobacteraceae bacterium]